MTRPDHELSAAFGTRLRQVNQSLIANGVDIRRVGESLVAVPWFVRAWRTYGRRAHAAGLSRPSPADMLPMLADRHTEGGTANGHYFHQDLWAARKIYGANPPDHIDVGSRIDGFVAHLLTFRSVTVVDIRPMSSQVAGLTYIQTDAVTLDGITDASTSSLSSLHALEHVGLGRYGDPLEPRGWRDAVSAIERVVASGGCIYIGVPIGRERTMFNAHRVFAPCRVIEAFAHADLIEFSAVDDSGSLVLDAEPADFAGAEYSCGLFEFRRRA